MDVLQLGKKNWADIYNIPKNITWEFNDFPAKKKHAYNVVIITEGASLKDEEWSALQWLVDPYNVLYLSQAYKNLSRSGEHFLKCQAATEIRDKPQKVIDNLLKKYFWGQSGIRLAPTSFIPLMNRINSFSFLDSAHLQIGVDSKEKWINIGSYRQNIFLDPEKLIKFWLEYSSLNVELRLRVFIQSSSGDGDISDSFIINADHLGKEMLLPIKFTNSARYAAVSLEVKGEGKFILGILHSRWARDGVGEFIAGGKRIVNLSNHEDIAYHFNPGDLNPPLNVYFSGARSLEGFEAYPLFRGLHAPSLLFTDMRLEAGEFCTTEPIEEQVKKVIKDTLMELGFSCSQLIMTGISMGTYPALKLGAQLGAYGILVVKPLANLGLIAQRGRIERPIEFATSFDVVNQLVPSISYESLNKLDEKFWDQFKKTNLTKTRLFVGYMQNDDYDNETIGKLKSCSNVKHSLQFIYKEFPGRHNDNYQINFWFIDRLHQILRDNFDRKE